ncbi:MAG TPA: hypothetical protein VK889_06830 [Solirubrobacterales bacterium]|nr:hypothetical protein [Solirubrobacterales bacterium]
MAQKKNEQEHQMLFDIRGRRKNVVRVVYAVLALLMGLSLFLVVGPNVGGIFDSETTSGEETAQRFEDRAEAIELKLKKDPENPDLLLALTRQRIYAGNALAVINPETGAVQQTTDSRLQLQQASNAWTEYLEATDDPSPAGAQLTAPMLFSLAETGTSVAEIEANVAAAAEAQEIVARARPSLGTLSTLAIYSLFTFDYPKAKKVEEEARGYANSKFERENLENQLEETEKRAREVEKSFVEFEKATKGQGKESLESPLGGLSGSLGP